MYRPGDRVRFETTGDDGWPLIRYGFVGGVSGNGGPIVVTGGGAVSDPMGTATSSNGQTIYFTAFDPVNDTAGVCNRCRSPASNCVFAARI